jgi:hypothetical protein
MSGFRLGNYDIDVVGKIEQKRTEYPLCDETGKEVTTEKGSYTKATYKNSEGVVLSKVYRLINGKPFDKFEKTKKVNKFDVVPKTEVYDLIIECFYLVKNEELKKELKEEDKAIRFIYSCGNGYKAYLSYLMPFQDKLIRQTNYGLWIWKFNTADKRFRRKKRESRGRTNRGSSSTTRRTTFSTNENVVPKIVVPK